MSPELITKHPRRRSRDPSQTVLCNVAQDSCVRSTALCGAKCTGKSRGDNEESRDPAQVQTATALFTENPDSVD